MINAARARDSFKKSMESEDYLWLTYCDAYIQDLIRIVWSKTW